MHHWSAEARREGAIVPLEALWALADRWYRDRLNPDWERLPADQVQALFAGFGLTGDFWQLTRG